MAARTVMRAVRVEGGAARLRADVPVPALRPDEVLVRVAATAVNRGDLMQVKGHYPPPPGASDVLGLEAAGVVVAVGTGAGTAAALGGRLPPGVPAEWAATPPPAPPAAVGTRVAALLAGGGYGEYVAVPARHCWPVPDDMPMAAAAALPEALATAYQCIAFVGGVTPATAAAAAAAGAPQRVLVHAGASGVGTAALQMAAAFGARAAGTCSAGKVAAVEALGPAIAAVPRIDARRPAGADPAAEAALGREFGERCAAALGGPADLIIDPVFGDRYAAANGAAVAPDGTVAVLSFLAGARLCDFAAAPYFAKRAGLRFTTLRSRPAAYKAALTAGLRRDVLPAVGGAIVPVVATVAPLAGFAEAHRAVGANEVVGKIVLEVDPTVQ